MIFLGTRVSSLTDFKQRHKHSVLFTPGLCYEFCGPGGWGEEALPAFEETVTGSQQQRLGIEGIE